MSQMSELSQAVTELRRCGETLVSISDVLKSLFSSTDCAATGAEPMNTGAKGKPMHSLEEVRALLAKKANAGHTDEVHALIEKYGASKLSQVDPANYDALVADAEVL